MLSLGFTLRSYGCSDIEAIGWTRVSCLEHVHVQVGLMVLHSVRVNGRNVQVSKVHAIALGLEPRDRVDCVMWALDLHGLLDILTD